ncbi:MAG: hypothetical protein LBP59_04780 [Planctomycetaceae bacterium]|jgi:hypothetical protein|nr:hypothetical protein [Planctomycetaceae bacterium]
MKKSGFGGQRFRWDSQSVIDAVGRVKAEALRLSGLDIQRTAKSSMKKAKKNQPHSEPDNPPFVHTGSYKNSIRFAWDAQARAVVVGAIKFKGQSKGAKALEHGGFVTVRVPKTVTTVDQRKQRGNERGYFAGSTAWISRNKKKRGLPVIPQDQEKHIRNYYKGGDAPREKTIRVTKKVLMKKRPAMNPALQKEIKKLPDRLKRARQKFK